MMLLTWLRLIGWHTARNRSADTETTMNIVALKEIPFNGCQMYGYVLLYHSGGCWKCCTIDFCKTESRMSMMSAIVRLKSNNNLLWLFIIYVLFN